nr:hypothetical protein Iba_chr13aCG13730 [Ipomoea batatas]
MPLLKASAVPEALASPVIFSIQRASLEKMLILCVFVLIGKDLQCCEMITRMSQRK